VDAVLIDGNGRLHPRQAGLATHVGVVLDCPTVGVAKSLLCGRPEGPIDGLDAGESVPILADEAVEAPPGSTLGAAVQTRQFEGSSRHVNPVFVSPGHRVGPATAVELVLAACDGYKLPEPLRLADRYADRVREGRRGRPKQ
ncbi:MAG: endonuclease V, partial [Halobacteriota archaeon]